MKRKISFILMAMTSALMSLSYADGGFGTLVFKSVSGESYPVETQELEIYFKDGEVSFNNNELVIPVKTLVSMEFADNSGVEMILPDAEGAAAVFSVDGIKAGEFPSLQEACTNLRPGIYVVRHSNGKTFKINVRQ